MHAVHVCRLPLAVSLSVLAIATCAAQASAQNRAKIEIVANIPHSGWVGSVAFSPDGASLISAGYDSIKLWAAASGQLLRTFEGHANQGTSLAFSPDGTRLISGSLDHTLRLWDVATGQLIRDFAGHSDEVTSVAISPDGTRVLSGSRDKTSQVVGCGDG